MEKTQAVSPQRLKAAKRYLLSRRDVHKKTVNMKQIISFTFFILISISATSFNTSNQHKLKNGFYYLAVTEMNAELIKDVDSEDVFAVEGKEIIAGNDLKGVKIVWRNFKPNPIKVIELKLNKTGRKKWSKIKNRISNSGESIVFICNDKIYLQKTIGRNTVLESSSIDIYLEPKYIENVFHVLKSEVSDSR